MENNEQFLIRLEKIKSHYEELQQDLINPSLSRSEMIDKQRELANLEDTYQTFLTFKDLSTQQQDLFVLLKKESDTELVSFYKEELKVLETKLEETTKELQYLLLPKDENDQKNIVVEIKGAVGGDEASLFAQDLYRMYLKYAEKKRYKTELLEIYQVDGGMFSKVTFIIKGKGVYARLKYESGVHRVQRVPETESQGRVHTSTATVYVMPEAEEVDVKIDPSDLRIDNFYSNGAGGQSVNTTMSAVRITHIPTGIVVTCQNERSQIQNKEKAMTTLRSKLYQAKLAEIEEANGLAKKSSIGAGMRSEKIRTYNFPQNRLSDHRYNITLKNLDEVMEGNLDLILNPLLDAIKTEELNNG